LPDFEKVNLDKNLDTNLDKKFDRVIPNKNKEGISPSFCCFFILYLSNLITLQIAFKLA
jgi:hypothetical protein